MSDIDIIEDERFPFYCFREVVEGKGIYGRVLSVEKETIERWEKVMAEFEQVQDEIEKAIEEDFKIRLGQKS